MKSYNEKSENQNRIKIMEERQEVSAVAGCGARARWRTGAGSALLECALHCLVLCVFELLVVLFC